MALKHFLLLCLISSACLAEPSWRVAGTVKQGETLRIEASGLTGTEALSAKLKEKTIRLFPNGAQDALGLMPIPVDLVPGSYRISISDPSGKVVKEIPVKVLDARFPKQNIVASKQMKELKPLPGEMDAMRALQQSVSDQRHWQEPFVSPTSGCMNSPFGVQRLHNGKPTGNYHRGLDLRSPMGTPVKAIADGVVRIAKMYQLHGGTIGIDHGQGVVSNYIHLSKLAVAEGASVKRGEVVAYVGATGFATGAHLHWSLYANGLPVNPLQWTTATRPCK